MEVRETAKEFYQRHGQGHSEAAPFNVFKIEEYSPEISIPFNRRDFYKITLVIEGQGTLIYSDKVIPIKDIAMVFTNPMIPYSYETVTGGEKGYFCLFPEGFINNQLKTDSLSRSPLFKAGGNPVLFPNEASMLIIRNIFELMLTENASSYVNKYEVLRNFVQIIIHESLKIDPPPGYEKATAPAERLTTLFLELLERQFPIPSPRHTLRLKNANEFADQLSVHSNHLNRVLKKTTGFTTSEHLSQRILKEAKILLLESDWDIAEIGYCLGFEHASNFYSFFKKQTGNTANQFRRQDVANS
ncbi:MAG TPA: helix-turn-helix transcriptional regulator [Puia sp.]|jgi:AraC-like DNA-binding protein|nr:helix-turn-helix transcriptional regulator [Puia sp.]